MKLRTKLILLLSTALVITMAVSTLLRIKWTRTRLEDQLRASAGDTAEAIAADLAKRLTPDKDGDEVAEELRNVKLRHPVAADLELNIDDTDEETTSTFSLPPNADEPQVAKRPKSARPRPPQARRDDARRALYDHGESGRRPGARVVEPTWRTPDRLEPATRWPQSAPAPPKVTRTFREGDRGGQRVFTVRVPLDPAGPRHGELVIAVSREPIERIVRTEQISSILITGGAVLLLMLLTTVIVDRVVARPVSNLELAMKRVESGKLGERVEVTRSDEIGALTEGFNAMLARIAEADGEIRAFNARLAGEVEAATVDLARKNHVLGQLNRLLLEARRELGDKERLAALGQLAAQLAHEIGTPLGSVSGHLQLAMSSRELPAPLVDRLQVASRELERVSRIVRDYLDSTRKVQPERQRVDVARLVEEALGIVQGDERRAEVQVARQLPAEVELYTDPGLLRQILVNLLTNAADAVLQAGAGGIVVSGVVDDGSLELAVRDDGVGIAAEDLARIFEPFYTTKGRGKGTGLGLAICRELALALGGRLAVESAPGRGSTFTVTLPRTVLEQQKERTAS